MELLDDKYQIEQLLGEGGIVIHPQLSRHDQFVAGQSKPVANRFEMRATSLTPWIFREANGRHG